MGKLREYKSFLAKLVASFSWRKRLFHRERSDALLSRQQHFSLCLLKKRPRGQSSSDVKLRLLMQPKRSFVLHTHSPNKRCDIKPKLQESARTDIKKDAEVGQHRLHKLLHFLLYLLFLNTGSISALERAYSIDANKTSKGFFLELYKCNRGQEIFVE